MTIDLATATAMAEKIGATCADAVLAWGEAIRDAEAAPDDKALELVARSQGRLVAQLGLGLVKTLRPVKR